MKNKDVESFAPLKWHFTLSPENDVIWIIHKQQKTFIWNYSVLDIIWTFGDKFSFCNWSTPLYSSNLRTSTVTKTTKLHLKFNKIQQGLNKLYAGLFMKLKWKEKKSWDFNFRRNLHKLPICLQHIQCDNVYVPEGFRFSVFMFFNLSLFFYFLSCLNQISQWNTTKRRKFNKRKKNFLNLYDNRIFTSSRFVGGFKLLPFASLCL